MMSSVSIYSNLSKVIKSMEERRRVYQEYTDSDSGCLLRSRGLGSLCNRPSELNLYTGGTAKVKLMLGTIELIMRDFAEVDSNSSSSSIRLNHP